MSVNEKIRKIREAKDWSQEQMAEKLNMSLKDIGFKAYKL